MFKFKVPLKERKDGAVYKAKIAVKYQSHADGKSTIALPDLSCLVVEIEAKSEGLAYKQLCQAFKPEDTRKIDGKGFLSMCEVNSPVRIYKTCEKHKQSYWHWDDGQDIGCYSCESDANYAKYEQEEEQEQQKHDKKLVAEIAELLRCAVDEIGNEKTEAVSDELHRYIEGTYEGYGSMKKAAVRKVATTLRCSEDDAKNLLEKLMR